MRNRAGRLLALLFVAVMLAASGTAFGQALDEDARPVGVDSLRAAPDYESWNRLAQRAESALANPRSTNLTLEQLREAVASFRGRFLEAQSASQARIATLRAQLEVLGPEPEEAGVEPVEISERRREINDQLARLQAPVVTAEEAFRRADGLIREVDRVLRERQADALIRLSPSPLNPAHWSLAAVHISRAAVALGNESVSAWNDPARRAEFGDRLPIIAGYVLLAIVLLVRGRRWMEDLTRKLHHGAAPRARGLSEMLVSFGQMLVPYIGVLALVEAIRLSGMTGLRGHTLVESLPHAGLLILGAAWLGGRLFPKDEHVPAPLQLTAERRHEGRVHATLLGTVFAIELLRRALFEPLVLPEAVQSVAAFPLFVLAGLLLYRLGRLLRLHLLAAGKAAQDGTIPVGYGHRLTGLVGRVAQFVGVLAPSLAAVGYMTAGASVLFPAALSLGLVGTLIVLQRLATEIYVTMMGGDSEHRDALVPVLTGFIMVILSLPLFALIWGVRGAEMMEVWERLREGFTLGETRISPHDFMLFLLVFAIGYTLTRGIQGALRTSVLPKTTLDKGGQNAVVSGLGYVGIFIAAVIAFTTAGIDLSSLAIVAGALSVGIGFGLQTVVSNFVSGIILLFERPVAEGDWIEVGGVMGTVRRIAVRSTVIETFDRTNVIVPNADLISGMVTNWTRFNVSGRLIVKVGVAYGTDARQVERILYEIAKDHPMVASDPPPAVLFRAFGADALEFEIRAILRDVNFILSAHSDINHEIAQRFEAAGIRIPFPQRDLWLRNPESLHANPAQAARSGPTASAASPESPGREANA